jgi:hypothetical protein
MVHIKHSSVPILAFTRDFTNFLQVQSRFSVIDTTQNLTVEKKFRIQFAKTLFSQVIIATLALSSSHLISSHHTDPTRKVQLPWFSLQIHTRIDNRHP